MKTFEELNLILEEINLLIIAIKERGVYKRHNYTIELNQVQIDYLI